MAHHDEYVAKDPVFIVRSEDRDNAGTVSSAGPFKITGEWPKGSYDVESVSFANTVYPVNSTNNTVYFTEDSKGALSCTLTSQNYTGSQLAAELETQMDSVATSDIGVSYDSQTYKLTVTSDTNNINFTFGTNTTNSAHRVLGFNAADGGAGLSLTSDNVVDLSGPRFVGIQIAASHSDNVQLVGKFWYATLTVQLLSAFGTVITWEPMDADRPTIHIGGGTPEVKVVYPGTQTPVDLNGGEWHLVLRRH